MTVVTGSFNVPLQSGNSGFSGSLWWQPTARHVSGTAIVLPAQFIVPVDVNGTMTPITVDPTGPTWVWKVTEQFNGIAQNVVRYVQVPASGTVAYKDLVDVDPNSLAPNAPVPGVVDGGTAAQVARFIQPRRDTAANWASANPVLAVGEPGLEIDTGRRKTGDGTTTWASLAYEGSAIYSAKILPKLSVALASQSNVTVAIAGDSTSDEAAEWWWRTWDSWSQDHPEWTLISRWWDDPSGTLINTTQRTGVRASCSVSENFNRTSASLINTASPRGGLNWGGADDWSINGTDAVWKSSTGYTVLPAAATNTSAMKTISGTATIDTTSGGANVRALMLGGYVTGSSIVRLTLLVQVDTAGGVSWKIDGQFPGYAAVVGPVALSLPVGTATAITWSLAINGTSVVATVNGATLSGTLSGVQQTAVQPIDGIFLQTLGTCTGYRVGDASLTQYITTGAPTLTVIVGSRAGTILSYQQARIAAMYPPGQIDALFVSSSHNYNSGTVSDYLVAVGSFLSSYAASHPESEIVLVQQNPETPANASWAQHRARCVALAKYASDHGYGCLNLLSAIEIQPTWQNIMIRSDGVHPTSASTFDSATDPLNGSYVQYKAARAILP